MIGLPPASVLFIAIIHVSMLAAAFTLSVTLLFPVLRTFFTLMFAFLVLVAALILSVHHVMH